MFYKGKDTTPSFGTAEPCHYIIMAQKPITRLIEESIEKMGLQQHIQFTPEEKSFFEDNFEPFHLKKGNYLITKDDPVNHVYYLEEGILNICFPDSKGGFINARFLDNKAFINPYFLHNPEHKARYSIKANTNCRIWKMEKHHARKLSSDSSNFLRLCIFHLESSLLHRIEREERIHCMTAEQRYERVLDKEKWLFKHLPLKEIARYIGITPQALSKARKKIFR